MVKTQLMQLKNGPRPLLFEGSTITLMLENMGHPDSELRDALIYGLFSEALEEDWLALSHKQFIVNHLLTKKLLFSGIDEGEGDLVFTRSFTALLFTSLLANDATTPFMTGEERFNCFEAACQYLMLENDTRDYVRGKGWAHAIAHGADMLTFAVAHPAFATSRYPQVYETLASALLRQTTPFIYGEEDRLSQVVMCLLDRTPTESVRTLTWLLALESQLLQHPGRSTFDLAYSHLHFKYYGFVQSLYFRLHLEEKSEHKAMLAELTEIIRRK